VGVKHRNVMMTTVSSSADIRMDRSYISVSLLCLIMNVMV